MFLNEFPLPFNYLKSFLPCAISTMDIVIDEIKMGHITIRQQTIMEHTQPKDLFFKMIVV